LRQRESSDTSITVTVVVEPGGVTDSPMRSVTLVAASLCEVVVVAVAGAS
jgi:hypothetical protein